MQKLLLSSKIHGAVITAARLHYTGSITIDREIMDAAGLVPFEQVHVLNLNNSERFETYTIVGRRGSRAIELNGPAARLGEVGDPVVILAYGWAPEGMVAAPKVVRLKPGNRLPKRR
ncbi:MAG: aspartate 1-decarboxylase [Candidatus Coatesbacteria bacterium]